MGERNPGNNDLSQGIPLKIHSIPEGFHSEEDTLLDQSEFIDQVARGLAWRLKQEWETIGGNFIPCKHSNRFEIEIAGKKDQGAPPVAADQRRQ